MIIDMIMTACECRVRIPFSFVTINCKADSRMSSLLFFRIFIMAFGPRTNYAYAGIEGRLHYYLRWSVSLLLLTDHRVCVMKTHSP